jgi:nitrogen-specific signal transduction histidine kinase
MLLPTNLKRIVRYGFAQAAKTLLQLHQYPISRSGICETDLENVLKPLVTSKSHGLGMGLSISRSIIIRHNSRIRVEN